MIGILVATPRATVAVLEVVFRESGRSAEELYIDSVHVTPLGNRIAATAIEAALRR